MIVRSCPCVCCAIFTNIWKAHHTSFRLRTKEFHPLFLTGYSAIPDFNVCTSVTRDTWVS